ncbi:LexA family protein [Parapedobacter soli]|uniref:LexA family protein n=1 Tax=Parapedobacter soli TaxID=416955 RepID=UPI0021C5A1EE|nr:translesion error-prone DNA polymerase V autoproteolytic subunit [Parapedobacter soli]
MEVEIFTVKPSGRLIPLFGERIHAGFESPATDYEEERIDLNDYVSSYPEATFYARVIGDCMVGSGIFDGDLLVVNRSLTPSNGDVVVGVLDGDFILRVYLKSGRDEYLMPDNPKYKPIKRTECTQFQIWGVVPHTILNQLNRKHVRADRLQQFLR